MGRTTDFDRILRPGLGRRYPRPKLVKEQPPLLAVLDVHAHPISKGKRR